MQVTLVMMVKKVQELLLEEENNEGGTEALHMIEEGDEVEDIVTMMNLKMWMLIIIPNIVLVADIVEVETMRRGKLKSCRKMQFHDALVCTKTVLHGYMLIPSPKCH